MNPRLRTSIAILALGLAAANPASADLFISEYVEGSSNNKAIEIYNPGGAPVDLGANGYKILMYFNGSATSSLTIPLAGVIAPGDVFVVAHSSAVPAILAVADLTNGSGWFNGDDAVVLAVGGANVVVDAIGQVGLDPGTEWGAGVQSTADNTIRRNPDVCQGDTDAGDAFVPSIQWTGFATDTFDGLGQHVSNCSPTPVNSKTWGSVKQLYR